jgi:DUF1680 family protein
MERNNRFRQKVKWTNFINNRQIEGITLNLSPKSVMRTVPFTNVSILDRFWAPRLQVNREETIPFEYHQCKTTGRIDAFNLDWTPGKEPKPHPFWDSDVAKWIEAASYSLSTHPDPRLEELLDSIIDLISSAQQPDGYLNTYFSTVRPDLKWKDLRDAHELYCAGHMMEAAVAHYQATGKRKLLDVMCRYADDIDSVFGREEGKKRGYCGHEEIELALVKLYHATGEERYIKLSQFFVDERGREPHYFTIEAELRGEPGTFDEFMSTLKDAREYNQSHLPVREQDRVVGHAVRAMYLYSAMADLARELGDKSLLQACEKLWKHVHLKNMYITGGIGSTQDNEGFTFDYDLPNETAYAETCASVGVVLWNHRMLLINSEGRYADAMERALYNGVLSGVSLDGTKFFYANPLASLGDVHRQEWFGVSCCPPNISRLLASLGQYVYSQSATDIGVHLYIQSEALISLDTGTVKLKQTTDYPWDGRIMIELELEDAAAFGLMLRIPGWCRDASLRVNGEFVDIAPIEEAGYVRIQKEWKTGDRLELVLAIPVEKVRAHPSVRQNAGRVALQRGPLVYCLEEVDNRTPLHSIRVTDETRFDVAYDSNTLNGIIKITGNGFVEEQDEWSGQLYRNSPASLRNFHMTAVPYYAWDNREPGQMTVWIQGT